jgi:hypothetical protein
MRNIGWFDIPADDVGRAKKFYQSLLGWRIPRAINSVCGNLREVDLGKLLFLRAIDPSEK